MVRIKHRYLLFNILYPSAPTSTGSTPSHLSFHAPTPSHLTPAFLVSHIRTLIATNFGDTGVGLATSSLKIIYFSRATSTAILRCPRAHVRMVWAALTYMNSISRGRRPGALETDCVVRVVRVSGTIRKSEEELIRRAKVEVVRARAAEERGEGDLLERLIGFPAQTGMAASAIDARLEDDESEAMQDDLDSEEEGATRKETTR